MLFNPRSIAIVGVPAGMNVGKILLTALLDIGFSGDIYPGNPHTAEIDGLKTYPNISAIQGTVDLAIVSVPHNSVLTVARKCAAQGVRGVVLFTGGSIEGGTNQGEELEKELGKIAQSSGMRLLGPNCMGIYSSAARLSFFPGLPKDPGTVGIISQSGSLAIMLGKLALQNGIRFSKIVSTGNECDLNSADLLAYFSQDSDTSIRGGYIEGIKNGPYFMKALSEATQEKPVVLWKTGANPEGYKAVTSHTGALSISSEVWQGVVRQTGAIPAIGFEEWSDMLMGFSLLPPFLGDRIAIVVMKDGLPLAAVDACLNAGIKLAEISPQTHLSLTQLISPTSANLSNPIDLSLTAVENEGVCTEAIRILASDPGVDSVLIVGIWLETEEARLFSNSLKEFSKELGKPFLLADMLGSYRGIAQDLEQTSILFFESVERAMSTYAKVHYYYISRKNNTFSC